MPLPEKRNDIKLTASTGTEAYGFQGSWAATNHIVLIGGYSYGNHDFISPLDYKSFNFDDHYRENTEFGLGYYFRRDSFLTVEILGGVDYFHRNFSFTAEEYNAIIKDDHVYINIQKPFIQCDIGSQFSNHGFIAASLKAGYVQSKSTGYYTQTGVSSPVVNHDVIPSQIIFEPSVTYRRTGRWFDWLVQAGTAVTKDFYDNNNANQGLFFIDFGVCLHLRQDLR